MAGQDLTSAFLLACDEQNLTLERVFSQHTHLANILGHRIMTKIYCFYMVNLKICTLNLFFTGVMPSLLCHLESYVKEINSLGIVLVFLFSQFSFSAVQPFLFSVEVKIRRFQSWTVQCTVYICTKRVSGYPQVSWNCIILSWDIGQHFMAPTGPQLSIIVQHFK